jgi:hypothetical protein
MVKLHKYETFWIRRFEYLDDIFFLSRKALVASFGGESWRKWETKISDYVLLRRWNSSLRENYCWSVNVRQWQQNKYLLLAVTRAIICKIRWRKETSKIWKALHLELSLSCHFRSLKSPQPVRSARLALFCLSILSFCACPTCLSWDLSRMFI